MQLRKGWFGYINSVIGTLVSGAFIYALFLLLVKNIEETRGTSYVAFGSFDIAGIISICITVLVIAFGFLFKYIKSLIRIKKPNEKLGFILYGIIISVLLLLFIARIVLSIFGVLPTDFSLNQMSVNRILSLFMGNVVSFDNSICRLYSYAMVFFAKVFGFSSSVLIICNAFIVCLSAIFVFFSVRILFGRLSACFTVLSFLIFGDYIKIIWNLDGLCLWVLFVSFAVFLLTYFGEDFIAKFPVTSFLIAFAVIFGFLALREYFFVPFDYFIPDIYKALIDFPKNYNCIYLCILLIFAVWGFELAFFNSKDNVSFVNICLVLSLFLFFFFDEGFGIEVLILFSAVAGLGMKALFFDGYSYIAETVEELIIEEEEQKPVVAEPVIADTKKEVENIDKAKKADIFKPIENPLPLPKKHVKKNMDFPIDISPDLMKFDIDIKPGDDYDIK